MKETLAVIFLRATEETRLLLHENGRKRKAHKHKQASSASVTPKGTKKASTDGAKKRVRVRVFNRVKTGKVSKKDRVNVQDFYLPSLQVAGRGFLRLGIDDTA